MPYDDPDPGDPNVLVGVSLPADEGATKEMAIAFAEEFAALGFDEKRLMSLFRRPHYAGAHRAYQLLGEAEIQRIVQEGLAVWGKYRVVVKDKEAGSGGDDLVQITVPTVPERSREPMRSREVDGASGVGGGAPTPLSDERGPARGGGAPRALRVEGKTNA